MAPPRPGLPIPLARMVISAKFFRAYQPCGGQPPHTPDAYAGASPRIPPTLLRGPAPAYPRRFCGGQPLHTPDAFAGAGPRIPRRFGVRLDPCTLVWMAQLTKAPV